MEKNLKIKYSILIAIWIILFNLFVGAAFPGPDYYNYRVYFFSLLKWNYILPGDTISPTGHIINGHSMGSSIFWAPAVLFRELVLQIKIMLFNDSSVWDALRYIYLSHWILAPLMIYLLWDLMSRLGATTLQKSISMMAIFFGTSLFYYTFLSISSEFPQLLLVTVLIYLLTRFQEDKRSHYYCLGFSSVALVLVRYDHLPFILLIFSFLFIRHFVCGFNRKRLSYLLQAGIIFFIGYVPVITTNYLFAGSLFRSPNLCLLPSGKSLCVGIGGLKTFEVLFSPWHGLFVYNPVLIFAVLGGLVFLRDDLSRLRRGKNFFSRSFARNLPYIFIVYFIFRVMLMSNTWTWFAGTGTFGGRGFILFFPAAMMSYAYLLKRLKIKKASHPLIILTLGLVFWTILLYVQEKGETNFYSYRDLINSQFLTLKQIVTDIVSITFFLVFLLVLLLVYLNIRFSIVSSKIMPLFLLCILFVWVILSHYPVIKDIGVLERLLLGILLYVVVRLCFTFCLRILRYKDFYVILLIFFILGILYLVSAGFNSLRVVTDKPVDDYKFCGVFDVQSVVETYYEYLNIEGYGQEKAEVKRLLDEYKMHSLSNETCHHLFQSM